jgi:sterol desaturase/sphingolipid hydroxylase (fatty acid hydroxylase superfamily)
MSTTPSKLEARLRRVFGDDDPGTIGSGWMAGTASVFLGALAVLGVLAFSYPALLTTAEFRARYPVPVLRALLEAVIGVGFLLGDVALGDGPDLGLTIGVDWFVLNVLLTAMVFVQFVAIVVLSDPMQYWIHRAFHTVPVLWRIQPLLDRLFGTQHLPGDAWPEAYGIHGRPVPEGWLRQLTHPFRRRG